MDKEQLKATFDQMAGSYDQIWAKLEPFNQSLYILMTSLLAKLPRNAEILCVGAGTGTEVIELARQFPNWRFTALDPSEQMIQMCQKKIAQEDLSDRCQFQIGYIEDIDQSAQYDAIISLLVSHFMVEQNERADFFRQICQKLKSNGLLINTDLTGDKNSPEYNVLLDSWFRILHGAEVTPEMLNAMRSAYEYDLGILSTGQVEQLLIKAGFGHSLHFYQLGMIHGWCSTRL